MTTPRHRRRVGTIGAVAAILVLATGQAWAQTPGPATASFQQHRIAALTSCTTINDSLDGITFTDTQTTPALTLPDKTILAKALALNCGSGAGETSVALGTLSLSVPESITGTLSLIQPTWMFTVTAANAPVVSAKAPWTGTGLPGYFVGASISIQDSGSFNTTCNDNKDGPTSGSTVTLGPCSLVVPGNPSEDYYLDNPAGGQTFRIITYFKVGAFFGAQVEVVVSSEYSIKAAAGLSLTVDLITVEQTVQNDQKYSTPIIAGKSAIVRVFPSVQGDNPAPLTGITGTLSGSGPGGSFGPLQPLPPQSGTVTARGTPIPTNQDDSLNFSLPAQFLVAGTLQLAAQVNPPAGQTGIDTSGNMLNAVVNVVAAPGSGELVVGYLPLSYEPPGQNKTSPSGNIANAYKLLNRVLPIGDGKVNYFPISAPGPVWTSTLNRAAKPKFISTMEKIYHVIDAAAPGVVDQFFVWVPRVYPYNCGDKNAPPPPEKGTGFPIGSSDPMWLGGMGHVAFGQDTTSTLLPNRLPGGPGGCLSSIDKYYLNMTLVHEIGHNLGLRHATTATQDLACGATVSAAAANWPYADSTIQQPGYDSISRAFKPNTKNDFMSYCSPPGNNTWISPFDYHQLFASGFSPHLAGPASTETSLSAGKPRAATSQVLILSGTVSMNGTTGSLDPGYLMPAGGNLDPSDPNGNYCLNLSGTGGALSSYCFTVNFGDDDPNDPDEVGPPFDERSFAVRLPFPAGTTQVQLSNSGTQLASLTATGQSPSVTITSPTAGATWQGSNTISWNASDPKGRSLMHTILYSSDGGKTFLPLSVDQPTTQLSLDTSQITGGSQVYFKVLTSAGLDTTTTTAGPITVVQTPQIAAPALLDFGGQGPSLVVDQDLTIMSTGTGPLTISSITISNPAFQVIDPLPAFPIPAGSQVIVTVRFAPAGTGSASGILTISSNDPAHPKVAVPLTAAGFAAPVPNIQADASLQFPNTPVGSPESLAFNITNTGGANLTVSSITSSNRVFAAMGTAVPFTLAPNAQQAVMIQFAPTSVGSATGTVTLATNDPVHPSVSVAMTGTAVSASTGSGSAPQITAGGVVNAADYVAKVSRGALAFAFGTNLAGQSAQAQTLPLQASLGGVSVTAAGIPAPVFIVNGTFIMFQVPYEVPLGTIPVVVTYNGVQSNTVNVTVADYALGVFTYNRTATIIDPDVFHLNGTLLTPSSPAVPSETVIVIANGIGKLINPPADGAGIAPPYPTAVDTPAITIGGLAATSVYAGLLAGDLGVVQMNVKLPANLPSGNLPLVIQFPGDSSPPVNLYVTGNIAATPKIGVTPSSLSFGSVTVGQTSSVTLSISNTGTATLTVNSITSSNGAFAATSPATPLTVQPGASITATVVFSPPSAGAQSGNLTISSNDPASPQVTVGVSGTGTSAAAPSITTSPATLAFGSVTVGKPQPLPLTIKNTGAATLAVNSIAIDNKLFTPSATSVSVAAGASFSLTVQFAPAAAGAQTGTLTLSTNDPAHPSVTVALTGTGVAAISNTVTLAVDGGLFTNGVGFPGSAIAVFVNRLTPPSYPATLTAIEIYFGARATGLPAGTTIELVAASNPSGSATFSSASAGVLNLYTAGIAALGAFNTYTLPAPITITSGDFVVGFNAVDPLGIFPADEDQTTKSQGRSYVSTDGNTFTVVDSFGAGVAGNFGIRALVTVGSQ